MGLNIFLTITVTQVTVILFLLGEDLIAWRTASGGVGLMQNACPHRGASMFYGRNEGEGLRCVYHGWKFDVTGACVDMPSEPPESNFKSKVKIRAYPCIERKGIIWTYMGPRETPPPLPELLPNLDELGGVRRVADVRQDDGPESLVGVGLAQRRRHREGRSAAGMQHLVRDELLQQAGVGVPDVPDEPFDVAQCLPAIRVNAAGQRPELAVEILERGGLLLSELLELCIGVVVPRLPGVVEIALHPPADDDRRGVENRGEPMVPGEVPLGAQVQHRALEHAVRPCRRHPIR